MTPNVLFCPELRAMRPLDNNEKRLILLENPVLEKLTLISVRWFIVTWAILLPLIALAGWGAVPAHEAIGLTCLGMLLWTLFEYAAHRFAFHFDANWQPAQNLIFMIHGNHHVQPRDLLRNLMPPIVSVPVGLCVWAPLYAIAGHAGTWVFLGFMIGYTIYDMTHYACHQWPMKGALGRAVKRHHMQHHFAENEGNYAITALFWDRAFGTQIVSSRRSASRKAIESRCANNGK